MVTRSHHEVATIIDSFVEGTGSDWDWDDFCSHQIGDRELDAIRVKCSELSFSHPPVVKGYFCNEEGIQFLRRVVEQLRRQSPG
jgi:hypothetical protein